MTEHTATPEAILALLTSYSPIEGTEHRVELPQFSRNAGMRENHIDRFLDGAASICADKPRCDVFAAALEDIKKRDPKTAKLPLVLFYTSNKQPMNALQAYVGACINQFTGINQRNRDLMEKTVYDAHRLMAFTERIKDEHLMNSERGFATGILQATSLKLWDHFKSAKLNRLIKYLVSFQQLTPNESVNHALHELALLKVAGEKATSEQSNLMPSPSSMGEDDMDISDDDMDIPNDDMDIPDDDMDISDPEEEDRDFDARRYNRNNQSSNHLSEAQYYEIYKVGLALSRALQDPILVECLSHIQSMLLLI